MKGDRIWGSRGRSSLERNVIYHFGFIPPTLLFFRKSLGWWWIIRLNGVYGMPYFHPFSAHTHTHVMHIFYLVSIKVCRQYTMFRYEKLRKNLFVCTYDISVSFCNAARFFRLFFGYFLHMLPLGSEQIIELEKTLSLLVNILWWQLFRIFQRVWNWMCIDNWNTFFVYLERHLSRFFIFSDFVLYQQYLT